MGIIFIPWQYQYNKPFVILGPDNTYYEYILNNNTLGVLRKLCSDKVVLQISNEKWYNFLKSMDCSTIDSISEKGITISVQDGLLEKNNADKNESLRIYANIAFQFQCEDNTKTKIIPSYICVNVTGDNNPANYLVRFDQTEVDDENDDSVLIPWRHPWNSLYSVRIYKDMPAHCALINDNTIKEIMGNQQRTGLSEYPDGRVLVNLQNAHYNSRYSVEYPIKIRKVTREGLFVSSKAIYSHLDITDLVADVTYSVVHHRPSINKISSKIIATGFIISTRKTLEGYIGGVKYES